MSVCTLCNMFVEFSKIENLKGQMDVYAIMDSYTLSCYTLCSVQGQSPE